MMEGKKGTDVAKEGRVTMTELGEGRGKELLIGYRFLRVSSGNIAWLLLQ